METRYNLRFNVILITYTDLIDFNYFRVQPGMSGKTGTLVARYEEWDGHILNLYKYNFYIT